jgi:hypothetical protein
LTGTREFGYQVRVFGEKKAEMGLFFEIDLIMELNGDIIT